MADTTVWEIHQVRKGLWAFFLIVLFRCWLARQTNSDHIAIASHSRTYIGRRLLGPAPLADRLVVDERSITSIWIVDLSLLCFFPFFSCFGRLLHKPCPMRCTSRQDHWLLRIFFTTAWLLIDTLTSLPPSDDTQMLLYVAIVISVSIVAFHLFLLSVCLSVCLSIYLSIWLSVYLSICLSVCLFIYLSIYLSIYISIYLPIYLPIYLSVCLSVYLSTYLSVCLSVYWSTYLSTYNDDDDDKPCLPHNSVQFPLRACFLLIHPSILSIHPSIYLPLPLPLFISLFISFYI